MNLFLPRQISHAERDDWHIFAQKPMHGADQTADKKPLTWVEARKNVV